MIPIEVLREKLNEEQRKLRHIVLNYKISTPPVWKEIKKLVSTIEEYKQELRKQKKEAVSFLEKCLESKP